MERDSFGEVSGRETQDCQWGRYPLCHDIARIRKLRRSLEDLPHEIPGSKYTVVCTSSSYSPSLFLLSFYLYLFSPLYTPRYSLPVSSPFSVKSQMLTRLPRPKLPGAKTRTDHPAVDMAPVAQLAVPLQYPQAWPGQHPLNNHQQTSQSLHPPRLPTTF